MILIVVVDDRNGMTFNHRRQSQDKRLRERILSMTKNGKLWMNAYSHKQFVDSEATEQIQEAEDFLEKAGEKDYCFVENLEIENFRDKIEKIILCKWNRRYPGDFFFTIDVNDGNWKLKDVEEFSGNSHEKITLEVYEHE